MAYARAYNTDHQSRLLLEAASMMVETRYLLSGLTSYMQACVFLPHYSFGHGLNHFCIDATFSSVTKIIVLVSKQ